MPIRFPRIVYTDDSPEPADELGGGPPEFTRAAAAFDLACLSDPRFASIANDVHVALDAYGRILEVRPMFGSPLGFPRRRLISRRLQHRVVVADRAQFQIALAIARSGQLPAPSELRFRARDESVFGAVLTPLAIAKGGSSIVIAFSVALTAAQDPSAVSRIVKCDPMLASSAPLRASRS